MSFGYAIEYRVSTWVALSTRLVQHSYCYPDGALRYCLGVALKLGHGTQCHPSICQTPLLAQMKTPEPGKHILSYPGGLRKHSAGDMEILPVIHLHSPIFVVVLIILLPRRFNQINLLPCLPAYLVYQLKAYIQSR